MIFCFHIFGPKCCLHFYMPYKDTYSYVVAVPLISSRALVHRAFVQLKKKCKSRNKNGNYIKKKFVKTYCLHLLRHFTCNLYFKYSLTLLNLLRNLGNS